MQPLLGVNIDHVATVRQARGETFPDPVEAALEAIRGGADGITAHLREDRRHIQDRDIARLKKRISVPLNMEMAVVAGIVRVAKKIRPDWICLVPERRAELTTEGGLNVRVRTELLKKTIASLQQNGSRVSLFVEPSLSVIRICKDLGTDAVEIHTGSYANAFRRNRFAMKTELTKIRKAARLARELGLLVNAGHGIDYENVKPLSRAFPFHEYNIGFSIVARSVFVGMRQAVKEMKERIHHACAAS